MVAKIVPSDDIIRLDYPNKVNEGDMRRPTKPAELKEKFKSLNKIPFRQSCVVEVLFKFYPREVLLTQLKEAVRDSQGPQQFKTNIGILQKKGAIGLKTKNGKTYVKLSKPAYLRLLDYNKKQRRIEQPFLIRDEKSIAFAVQPKLENNRKNGKNGNVSSVHRWYGYLEAFSSDLVRTKIKEYDINNKKIVFDPFCGSGTVLVDACMLGIPSVGVDANPAMIKISEIKTSLDVKPKEFGEQAKKVVKKIRKNMAEQLKVDQCPPLRRMPDMERRSWFDEFTLKKVDYAWNEIITIKNKEIKGLFELALITTLRKCSNVQFAPGTSFYPYREKPSFLATYWKKLTDMYFDLKEVKDLKRENTELIVDDSRFLAKLDPSYKFDFLITSPPYPNDLEYTAQTRLELYLMGVAKNMPDVLKIKKGLIVGSTKQVWKHSNNGNHIYHFETIKDVTGRIAEGLADKNWGFNYPKMVEEYFGDIYLHLKSTKPFLNVGAPALYVVGDQSIKGVLIPVADILGEIAQELGYSLEKIELYRIRRSTGQVSNLREKIVCLSA